MSGKTAQLFNTDGSQSVRLPAEFRFEGNEVLIRRDERTGDVILSKHICWNTWKEYFASRDEDSAIPDEFMNERPLNVPFHERSLFEAEI